MGLASSGWKIWAGKVRAGSMSAGSMSAEEARDEEGARETLPVRGEREMVLGR